jgi:GTP cyclohydrolase I
LLIELDPDHERAGLKETPLRTAKAWEAWTSGYRQDPKSVFKMFKDGAEKVDEMVALKGIPFYSHCEHHLAPFFGEATVAYIPNGKIIGLSKLSRLVEIFAHRFQVQERMTNQIADALVKGLTPLGVGVVMRARHFCMESRGIRQQGIVSVTSALRGVMRTKPEARAEFFELANGEKR